MKNPGQQKNFFSFASQLLIVTTATPISFDTELTLLFSGGSTFLKIESRNVFVYFIVAPPMGDNYIDTFREFKGFIFVPAYRRTSESHLPLTATLYPLIGSVPKALC